MKHAFLVSFFLISGCGAAGSTGANGSNGSNGANGAPGPTGAAGERGDPGPAGAPGAMGPTGPAGTDGAGAAAPLALSASAPTGFVVSSTNDAKPQTDAPSDGFAGPGIFSATGDVSSGLIGTHAGVGSSAGKVSAGVYGRNTNKGADPGYHYGVIGMSSADFGAGVLAQSSATNGGAGLYAMSWTSATPIVARNWSNSPSGKVIDVEAGSGVGLYAAATSSSTAAVRTQANGTAVGLDANAAPGATAVRARGRIDLGTGTESEMHLPIYNRTVFGDADQTTVVASCESPQDRILGGGCQVSGSQPLIWNYPGGTNSWYCAVNSGTGFTIVAHAICLRGY